MGFYVDEVEEMKNTTKEALFTLKCDLTDLFKTIKMQDKEIEKLHGKINEKDVKLQWLPDLKRQFKRQEKKYAKLANDYAELLEKSNLDNKVGKEIDWLWGKLTQNKKLGESDLDEFGKHFATCQENIITNLLEKKTKK